MSIIRLSIKQLANRPLQSLVSILLFAVGMGIISLVISIESKVKDQFFRSLAGIDLVVGAKGSPLQLILSSVFHIDTPTGNIQLREADEISGKPFVRKTIPISLGDNYRGYRIVGTTPEYGELYKASLASGDWFISPYEAVIGSEVARKTQMEINEQFTGRHGFNVQGHHHDEDFYTVKGILRPTGTVIDQLILTTLDTYWLIHGNHEQASHPEHLFESGPDSARGHDEPGHGMPDDHDHAGSVSHENGQSGHTHDHTHGQEAHDHGEEEAAWQELINRIDAREDLSEEEMQQYRSYHSKKPETPTGNGKEITALLVFYATPRAAVQLPGMINKITNLQAASPAFEAQRLFALAGNGISLLRWLAWIIIVISGLNVFIHLSNTLSKGIHEIALIRSLGASRMKVMGLLMLQGIWLAVAGWMAGILIAKVIMVSIPIPGIILEANWILLTGNDWMLLTYAVTAGVLSSLVPGLRAYRSDVHFILNKA